MSKKNNKGTRARLHQFDLKREKEENEKKAMKQKKKAEKLKVKLKKTPKFGKKGKLTAAAKAAVAKSMEIDT